MDREDEEIYKGDCKVGDGIKIIIIKCTGTYIDNRLSISGRVWRCTCSGMYISEVGK